MDRTEHTEIAKEYHTGFSFTLGIIYLEGYELFHLAVAFHRARLLLL